MNFRAKRLRESGYGQRAHESRITPESRKHGRKEVEYRKRLQQAGKDACFTSGGAGIMTIEVETDFDSMIGKV